MSQQTALRALDAKIMAGLKGAGLADSATFLAKDAVVGTVPTPCDAYVDRDVRLYGDDEADVATVHTVVTLFRSQVEPHRGARVTVEGETFLLEGELTKDESRARWAVVAA